MTRKKRRALLCMLAVPLLALAPRSEESLPASAAEPAAVPEKYVALTFDDGPWPETTEQLLDGLAERERKVISLRFGLEDGHPRTLEEVGREFGVKTVYTSLILPVFLWVFEQVFPDFVSLNQDAMMDTVCYIFVVSVGLALLFWMNASSGGLDIVAKLLNKYFHMELGKAMALPGMCVALSSVFFSDKKLVVLGILGTYLNGIVLDHFIFGLNLKKRVCIISEKEEEIRQFILHTLHSGATIYQGFGAFDNEPKTEIITIVDKNEYAQLMPYILKTDPKAFVTVYAVNEIIYRPKR